MTTLKQCRTCKFEKPLEDFYPHKLGKMGRHPNCIECFGKRQRATKQRKRLEEAGETLSTSIFDEKGRPVDLATLPEAAQANILAYVAADKNRDKVLEHNHPAEMLPEFVASTAATALMLTMRVPPFLGKSCSCCRSLDDVDDRDAYRICRRCATSVDVCGRCVIHPSVLFRPELAGTPAPPMNIVLAALGELTAPVTYVPSPAPPDDD